MNGCKCCSHEIPLLNNPCHPPARPLSFSKRNDAPVPQKPGSGSRRPATRSRTHRLAFLWDSEPGFPQKSCGKILSTYEGGGKEAVCDTARLPSGHHKQWLFYQEMVPNLASSWGASAPLDRQTEEERPRPLLMSPVKGSHARFVMLSSGEVSGTFHFIF